MQDYYFILGIPPSATKREIKTRYRQLVKKWHPDVNKDIDSTAKMQEIVEAYWVLSNSEARKRYDIEFAHYKEYIRKQNTTVWKEPAKKSTQKTEEDKSEEKHESASEDYKIRDDILQEWIKKAKVLASDFVNQARIDTIGISKRGIEYAKKSSRIAVVVFVILFILTIIILSLSE